MGPPFLLGGGVGASPPQGAPPTMEAGRWLRRIEPSRPTYAQHYVRPGQPLPSPL